MIALDVFDTQFGNTERIARAIGEGLASVGEVLIVRNAWCLIVDDLGG